MLSPMHKTAEKEPSVSSSDKTRLSDYGKFPKIWYTIVSEKSHYSADPDQMAP